MQQDMMIDIEALGTRPGSKIVSIGAVMFDFCGDGGVSEEHQFYRGIDITQDTMAMDPDTVLWWMGQSQEARDSTFTRGYSLREVLDQFGQWVRRRNPWTIWANDPDFDLVLLSEAHHHVGQPVPWKFGRHRSFRTVKDYFVLNDVVANPNKHNALQDAIHQAKQIAGVGKQVKG